MSVLKWEMFLDGWVLGAITHILVQVRSVHGRRPCDHGRERWCCWPWWWRKGPQAKGCKECRRKDKETFCSRASRKEQPLTLAQWDPLWTRTSDPQNHRTVNVCHSKPPSVYPSPCPQETETGSTQHLHLNGLPPSAGSDAGGPGGPYFGEHHSRDVRGCFSNQPIPREPGHFCQHWRDSVTSTYSYLLILQMGTLRPRELCSKVEGWEMFSFSSIGFQIPLGVFKMSDCADCQ